MKHFILPNEIFHFTWLNSFENVSYKNLTKMRTMRLRRDYSLSFRRRCNEDIQAAEWKWPLPPFVLISVCKQIADLTHKF